MLGFLQPMIFQQTLELPVEILIVLDAFDVVPESHPLDVQNRDSDSQRTMRKHEPLHVLGRANEITLAPEACFELLSETLKKMNVLDLLTREPEQGSHAIVVCPELQPRMVHHVGKNKFFDETEHSEVLMAPDLIQSSLFLGG